MFRLGSLIGAAREVIVKDYFDRLALDRAIDGIAAAHRRLTAEAVAQGGAGPAGVEAWSAARGAGPAGPRAAAPAGGARRRAGPAVPRGRRGGAPVRGSIQWTGGRAIA